MLVGEIVVGKTLLVRSVNGSEKPRLLKDAGGATIDVEVGRHAVGKNLLEPGDALTVTPKLIVEADDLGDDPRPNPERRLRSGSDCVIRGRADDRVALES